MLSIFRASCEARRHGGAPLTGNPKAVASIALPHLPKPPFVQHSPTSYLVVVILGGVLVPLNDVSRLFGIFR